jgi:hypothetical protein
MPCCIGCLALVAPRLTIVLMVIFTDYIGRAYDTLLWPLLGFIFMPTTTLAYAWAINARGELVGLHLAVFIVAVLIDLGILGGNARQGRRYWDGN